MSLIIFDNGDIEATEVGRPTPNNRNIALFCLQFAVNSIFLIKENKLPSDIPQPEPARRFKALNKCPVWVNEKQGEVIRYIEKEEMIDALHENHGRANHIAIIQDEEKAFVESKYLEPIPPES